jgi:hypothetical protein
MVGGSDGGGCVRALLPYSYLLACTLQDGGSATSQNGWLRTSVAMEIVVEIQYSGACGPVYVLFFRIQHEMKCECESVSVDSCAPQCPPAPPADAPCSATEDGGPWLQFPDWDDSL